MAHASIIIPVHNQLRFTAECLESLLRDDDRCPYEVIVVDNGSSDDTRQYLERKCRELDRTRDRLVPIFNEKNLGVAPAWNQGLKTASGSKIAILNNDIVLSRGWFRGMLWALEHHKLGLVSPFAAVGKLNYDFESRARQFTRKNLSKLWADYDFCAVVMPRWTFEKVGFFDENFKVGGYEDTDYCYRLKTAGIRYGVSGAAFVHHFGSQTLGTFKRLGDRHVGSNRDYFISKWKADPSLAQVSAAAKLQRSWRKFKMHWDCM